MSNSQSSFKGYLKSIRVALGYSFSIAPIESTFMFIFDTIYAALPYATAWFLGHLVNTLIIAVQNPEQVNTWGVVIIFIAYAVMSSLPNLLGSIDTYITRSWRFKLEETLEIFVLRKRIEVDIAHYEDPKFQDLTQRAFQRSHWPLLELAEIQFKTIQGILGIIIGSILATAFSWQIYLILLASSIPKFVVEYKYGFRIWSIWMKQSPEQRRFIDLRKYFINRLNIVETKLMQTGEYLLSWAKNIIVNFNRKQLQTEKSRTFHFIGSEFLALVGFITAAYLILQEVLGGAILVGSMVYLLSTLSNVRHSFANTLAEIARQNERHLIVKDMIAFFETKPIIPRAKNPKKLELNSPPEIIFENVSFKYPTSEDLSLKNINLKIKPGQKIGLVGNNGAGKTTFIKLLCRIYDPTEGRIIINGLDLKDLDFEEWWSYLGIMLQDYSTYDFVTKDAIAIGRTNKELDMDEVKQAAKVSQSDEFIERWEKKYDNPIGVEFGGVEPSKGQRQKLAIAKTIYRNPFVIVLDEPTASVDAESEAKIFDSLENLPTSMSAILISHDFSTIKDCDHIFVFDRGELKEEGTHDELLSKNDSLYKKLWELQAGGFLPE